MRTVNLSIEPHLLLCTLNSVERNEVQRIVSVPSIGCSLTGWSGQLLQRRSNKLWPWRPSDRQMSVLSSRESWHWSDSDLQNLYSLDIAVSSPSLTMYYTNVREKLNALTVVSRAGYTVASMWGRLSLDPFSTWISCYLCETYSITTPTEILMLLLPSIPQRSVQQCSPRADSSPSIICWTDKRDLSVSRCCEHNTHTFNYSI